MREPEPISEDDIYPDVVDDVIDAIFDYGDPWNPIEQGMYDDDPSPYDGTYSEE